MTLMILDPGMMTPVAHWYGANPPFANFDLSNLTDHAAASPTFDTQAAVYTSSPTDQASQNSIGNNLNGLQNPLHVIPTLSYAYTSGYMTQNSFSKAVTVGITQSFSYDFFAAKAATTISASGTFTWTNGSSTNNSTTITNSISAPFDVPPGKIYEEKLLFDQQQVTVPYTVPVYVDGTFRLSDPSGVVPPVDVPIGKAFGGIEAEVEGHFSNLPAPYKDVNWGDVHEVTDNEGFYDLHGTLTVDAASVASVQIFDITNGAAADAADLVSQYDVTPAMLLGGQPGPVLGGQPVPEPASFAVLGTGLLGLGFAARARRVAACWARCRDILSGRTGATP